MYKHIKKIWRNLLSARYSIYYSLSWGGEEKKFSLSEWQATLKKVNEFEDSL
jgi:hypothetical protein